MTLLRIFGWAIVLLPGSIAEIVRPIPKPIGLLIGITLEPVCFFPMLYYSIRLTF